jgi:NAD(P)H dehydrogenase (quinone)
MLSTITTPSLTQESFMIIVTGATGQLGRRIVEKLLDRVPATRLGASVRDPDLATDLTERDVRVRQGDFDDPDSLRTAFEGCSQLLLVSSNAAAYGGDPLAQHRTVIGVAREIGVKRIVYTSHMAASASSAFPPMRDHAATESMLDRSGLAWTALRNGFYASSGIMLMGDSLESGVIDAPRDGKVSWTAHADLAEAAAIILAGNDGFDGPTPALTGSEALDLGDLAQIASDLSGRTIRREISSDDDYRAKMTERGVPPRSLDFALGLYLASRNGEFASVDPTLEQLLGRHPTRMRDLMAETIGRSR